MGTCGETQPGRGWQQWLRTVCVLKPEYLTGSGVLGMRPTVYALVSLSNIKGPSTLTLGGATKYTPRSPVPDDAASDPQSWLGESNSLAAGQASLQQ
jgi:hypothetical protein